MASIDNSQSEFPAGEDLVAYLDGELPPDDCRRVEERLAVDPVLRQQLHDLDQAWDALDALPQPTAGDEFARTTIEMVAVASQQDVAKHTASAAANERRRRLMWALFGGAALIAGFAGARVLLPDSNRALLADLPVVEQFDLLTQIGDIDFLRKLASAVPLEQLADDTSAVDREVQQIAAASKPTRQERRQWIETLSPADKAELNAQFKRYDKTQAKPEERQRLRDLEKEISSQSESEADKLRRTMIAYGQWLSHRPSLQDKLLRAKTADERVSLVQSLIQQDDRRAARQLSPEDSANLRKEILAIAEEHKAEFLEELNKRNIQIPKNLLNERPNAVAFWIVMRELRNDETRRRLIDQLSPAAREQLEGSGRQRRERSFGQLPQWMVSSLEPKRDPAAVENFFATSAQLSDEERAELLSKSAAEMEAELERRYFGAQLGVGDKELQRVFGEWGRSVFGDWGRGPLGPPGPGREEFGPDRRRPPFDRPGGPGGRGPGGPGGPPPREDGEPNGFNRGDPDRGPGDRGGPGGPRRGPGGPEGPPLSDRRPPRPPGDGPPPPENDRQ